MLAERHDAAENMDRAAVAGPQGQGDEFDLNSLAQRCGEPKTQARIQYTLKTGKTLRN